jgi:hypothetical protein
VTNLIATDSIEVASAIETNLTTARAITARRIASGTPMTEMIGIPTLVGAGRGRTRNSVIDSAGTITVGTFVGIKSRVVLKTDRSRRFEARMKLARNHSGFKLFLSADSQLVYEDL